MSYIYLTIQTNEIMTTSTNTPTLAFRTTPYIFTTVTLEDLKEYKSEIITEIKKYTSDVKEVMEVMVINLATTKETCEIEYTKEVLCEMGYFNNASSTLAAKNRENAMNNLPSSMR